MTKVDKDNYKKNVQLPVIYNDAHASLRGFAQSEYSHIEEFDDFFLDANSYIKKKIILKVSDFRSAMIQGNPSAKSKQNDFHFKDFKTT